MEGVRGGKNRHQGAGGRKRTGLGNRILTAIKLEQGGAFFVFKKIVWSLCGVCFSFSREWERKQNPQSIRYIPAVYREKNQYEKKDISQNTSCGIHSSSTSSSSRNSDPSLNTRRSTTFS